MKTPKTGNAYVILSEVEGSNKYSLVPEILRRRSFHSLAQNDTSENHSQFLFFLFSFLFPLGSVILSEVERSKRKPFNYHKKLEHL